MTAAEDRQRELGRQLLERWRDPVLFTHEALGLQTWRGQRDILHAAALHRRVAVRSGHKVAKSTTAACLALHWLATKRRARVILTAPSHRQVESVLWKEIRRIHRAARFQLGGIPHLSAEAGLQLQDGREIIGFSTVDPERMAGFSGPNMLYIVDEASGVHDKLHEAIAGGPANILMTSNPTQTTGAYYDAFESPRSTWHKIHISSLEAAAEAHLELGPDTGIATQSWCDERLAEWGPDDPRYQVRVLGNFPSQDSSAMIPKRLVTDATERWSANMPRTGRLQVGVDVARYGPDTSAIVASRGSWCSRPVRLKGNDNVEVARAVLGLVMSLRLTPSERVSVRIDTSNNGGVKDVLKHGLAGRADENLELVEMVASASSPSAQHSRLRDHAWAMGRKWLEDGGAIPPEASLTTDLTTPRLGFDEKGRIKVEGKKEMRKRIGRSTDDGDAFCLAVYPTGSSNELAAMILSDAYRAPEARM